MADDEEDDVYDEEFDFVDDLDDDEVDVEPEEAEAEADADVDERAPARASTNERDRSDRDMGDRDIAERENSERDYDDVPEDVVEQDPYATPPPAANYVVHIYEYRQFKRTVDRPFTGEDAEAFASEYNRTSKSYGRFAVAGKNDAKPHKNLDDR